MPNINTAILSQMPVLVPAIEEQRQIAAALRASEMKIRALEAELPFAEELFDALLEELMSGHLSIERILARQERQ
jgi:restriction endonuclease S subunit